LLERWRKSRLVSPLSALRSLIELPERYCQLNGPRVKSTPEVAGFTQATEAALHSLKERSRSNL
jgi:hypothetical protein